MALVSGNDALCGPTDGEDLNTYLVVICDSPEGKRAPADHEINLAGGVRHGVRPADVGANHHVHAGPSRTARVMGWCGGRQVEGANDTIRGGVDCDSVERHVWLPIPRRSRALKHARRGVLDGGYERFFGIQIDGT